MSVILPNLLLGDVNDALMAVRGSTRPQVSAILTMAAELPLHQRFAGLQYFINYKYIPMDDSPSQDLLSNLPEALNFIHSELEQGHTVLVHCAAGISRSASVVIAYLMMTRGMTLAEAYQYVKSRRPIVEPNPGFIQQLSTL